jgi:hypothetical protein
MGDGGGTTDVSEATNDPAGGCDGRSDPEHPKQTPAGRARRLPRSPEGGGGV